MIEWAKFAIQIVVLTAAVLGAYYKMDARISLAEQQISQETKGYENLLSSFNTRMDKLDEKMQCLIDKRFCY